MAASQHELRELVQRYVSGGVSLYDFRELFVEVTDGLSYREGTALDDLASEVELAYAEYSNGDISEIALKSRLAAALRVTSLA